MGQAMSLTELEDCVLQAFSDQLLISHGLFPTPYPRGTHVKCEVDIAKVSNFTGWQEGDSELVIQIVKTNRTCCKRECLTESEKVRNKDYADVKIEKEPFSLKCSMGDEDLKSFQANIDCSNESIDCPYVNTEKEPLSPKCNISDEDWQNFQENIDHSSECAVPLAEVCDAHLGYIATDMAPQQNRFCTCNSGQSFCATVLSLITLLSPNIVLEDASFDVVINMLHQWVISNKNVSVPRSPHRPSLARDHRPSKASGDQCDPNLLFPITRGKAIHPNIVPILGACKNNDTLFIVYPAVPFTLESLLHFSPKVLDDDWDRRFLVYQLLSGTAFFHDQGIVHHDLKPSNILLTDKMWCWITGFCVDSSKDLRNGFVYSSFNYQNSYMCEHFLAEIFVLETALNDLQSAFRLWCKGELSNYDYLLVLNKLAGRRWGDRKFHIVMPWVIDFSVRPDKIIDYGWRDLTKSKWRLAKGDEQLDFTYATAEIPHHVSDECLSELAVCIYKARRLPLFILRQSVRAVYEPNEYPATLQRLYQWTPDECIPEFYSDASIFSSIHMGMSDLAVPSWAKSAEDFILWHREALEGKHVSNNLHHWIDLTFGYKLSGEAAIDAKNVTLSAANPILPRSQGRRQLFTVPHPRRKQATARQAYKFNDGMEHQIVSMDTGITNNISCTTASTRQPLQAVNLCMEPDKYCSSMSLEMLEETASFCESLRNLSPLYISSVDSTSEVLQEKKSSTILNMHSPSSVQDLPNLYMCENREFKHWSLAELLQALKVEASSEGTFQDCMLWQSKAMCNNTLQEGTSCDIFALGCIIAELYLGRPLFDPISLRNFDKHGREPAVIQRLPAHVQSIVRLMIERNPLRRISAACLLESPFFPPTVRAVHSFISSLYLIGDQNSRLEFVARLASHGAFIIMGPLAARKCISFCLSPLVLPHKKVPVQECIAFLTAALLALKPHDAKLMLIPVIQKLLQGEGNHELKVALLQVSFVKKIYKCVGITLYLKLVHPVVLSALQQSEDVELGVAASTLLIESWEELGVPVTCSQTIGPLLQQFGRDLSIFAIDTVVGIGKRLDECLVVKHLLPSLRAMIFACLNAVSKERSGPARSWRMLVMHDTIVVLEHFLHYLPSATIFSTLVQEPHNVVESLLLHSGADGTVRQHAAKALLSICQSIGPDATAGYILPRLQPLFALLAFDHSSATKDDIESYGSVNSCTSLHRISDDNKPLADDESRRILNAVSSSSLILLEKSKIQLDLVHDLYIGLASLLGIERLRQCLSTWLILEQLLLKLYGWQWETGGGAFQEHSEKSAESNLPFTKPKSDLSPTSLLLNEIGWSVPQPLLNRGKLSNKEDNIKQFNTGSETGSINYCGPWMWMPCSEDFWEDIDYLNRTGLIFNAAKDECPWKVKATVSHAWRAHPGPIKAVAVGDGETTIFTAGVGAKMRGLVKQWQLSTTLSIMDYTGHEEAVNDICVLPWTQRVASCDGSIHLWDTQTGDCVVVFSEFIRSPAQSSGSVLPENSGLPSVGSAVTSGTAIPGGMSFTGLHGNHYTCMHILEMEQKLVAGTGNGHLRFFDLPSGQSLHLWRCDLEASSPLVSAITSSEKQFSIYGGNAVPSAWIAAGFGLGLCKLFDSRVGNFVASWRAHEGFITKLAAFEDHYLMSSSLDKTLCLWDLRRTAPAQLQVFHGHSHGISSFEAWSNTLLSAGGNKIGISTLSHPMSEAEDWQIIRCHKLFSADLPSLNLSSITAMNVLPFSHFFVVGSDDGYLRVCK